MNDKIKEYADKMQKSFDFLKEELASIRAGRANPHVLDKIKVDYYGTPTPLQQVGNVSVPEARIIQIAPWDKTLIKDIEKAIMTSDLGITPTNDGAVIRLVFPELTEERRKQLAKDIRKKGEDAKVAVRNVRRDGNDALKKLKGSDVSEDEINDLNDELQKVTDKYIKDIDAAVEDKNKEIMNVPQHVAIILDGNGRWAKAKGMPRNYGHMQGAKAVEDILVDARDIGIKYLTVYAFSTENWSRPEAEVSALMTILRNYLKTSIKKSMKNNVRCRVIGDRSALSDDIVKAIEELEEATAGNTGLTFTIAINYGSRDEITRSVKKIAKKVESGELKADDITEQLIAENLDTDFLPDPDLMIRTCNEQRVSNFLLWQLAYTEFYYTPIAWPDFDKAELIKAVEAYGNRNRKFGGLKKDQV